eukprot:COSAG01_NODE_12719_length_1694_cov_1.573041_2_plen_312_part_00
MLSYFPGLGASIAIGMNSYQGLSTNQGWGFWDGWAQGSWGKGDPWNNPLDTGWPRSITDGPEQCQIMDLAIHAALPDFPALACGQKRDGFEGLFLSFYNSRYLGRMTPIAVPCNVALPHRALLGICGTSCQDIAGDVFAGFILIWGEQWVLCIFVFKVCRLCCSCRKRRRIHLPASQITDIKNHQFGWYRQKHDCWQCFRQSKCCRRCKSPRRGCCRMHVSSVTSDEMTIDKCEHRLCLCERLCAWAGNVCPGGCPLSVVWVSPWWWGSTIGVNTYETNSLLAGSRIAWTSRTTFHYMGDQWEYSHEDFQF